MNTFTCIVVDDDHFATAQIAEYILKIPALKLIDCFNDPLEAIKRIKKINKPVDFLFIDVEMPNMSGIELAGHLVQKYNNLILVSAHVKYALEGYGINARQFLAKPFDFKKFNFVMREVIEKFVKEKPFIMVKLGSKNEVVKIYTENIIVIEGASNYIKIHTLSKIYVPYYKLSSIDEDLKIHPDFLRINRSNIISAKHIKKVEGYKLMLKNGLEVSVSDAYKGKFDWFLTELIRKY
ncbi:response regulator transcription factor [Pedobacter sp. MR2016-19]|uniref:LytR/AlgR family response regulator transcription factor n=1 Tax=Pedobacter sp. MR2016-19 TaxID=2780089 RepID=UPI0018768A21|nr:LytTR family DNA-binding domain-containing protein [Pedobacter sp. MR2016-19]MBE5322231.1 response regulator transcription factor [Pedobacter sp. MR2016-19]